MARTKSKPTRKKVQETSSESASTEEEQGLSTENATAEEAQTTTTTEITTKKKVVPSGSDRVLRSRSAATADVKGKGKEVVRVDEKAIGHKVEDKARGKKLMAGAMKSVVTSEEVGDTPTKEHGTALKEKIVPSGSGRILRSHTRNKGNETAGGNKGIDGGEAAKKAKGKANQAEGKNPVGRPSTKMQSACEHVMTSGEIGGGKKGIGGSKASKKTEGKKPVERPSIQVRSDSEDVKNMTSSKIAPKEKTVSGGSGRILRSHSKDKGIDCSKSSVVSNEEKQHESQSEKNANAEKGKSKKRKSEPAVPARRNAVRSVRRK